MSQSRLFQRAFVLLLLLLEAAGGVLSEQLPVKNYWIPTAQGIYRFSGNKSFSELATPKPTRIYTVDDGMNDNSVFRLFEDARGDLWFATLGNAFRSLHRWERSSDKIHIYTPQENGIPASGPTAFANGHGGNLWMGFYTGGVCRYANERFTQFTEKDGVLPGFVRDMLLDRHRISNIHSPAHPSPYGSFPFTVERRDRAIYFSALRNGDKENFFGAVVAGQPVNQAITLNHLVPTAEGATLEIALQGVTYTSHLVSVQLNGEDVGQLALQGQDEGRTTVNITASRLREGTNQVTLVARGGPSDVSLVDYIRLTYQHSFNVDQNKLRFTASGGQQVTIGGFTVEFYRQLFANSRPRLGDAAVRSKASTSDLDVRRTWVLFGDPTMRLK